ncbi:MAG: hypothetical protein D3910_24295 [Candidatus Electrothrix sp. ATG2]|nr:hypothetical protein [Candidatus Electrothrix sp. ATG2]
MKVIRKERTFRTTKVYPCATLLILQLLPIQQTNAQTGLSKEEGKCIREATFQAAETALPSSFDVKKNPKKYDLSCVCGENYYGTIENSSCYNQKKMIMEKWEAAGAFLKDLMPPVIDCCISERCKDGYSEECDECLNEGRILATKVYYDIAYEKLCDGLVAGRTD